MIKIQQTPSQGQLDKKKRRDFDGAALLDGLAARQNKEHTTPCSIVDSLAKAPVVLTLTDKQRDDLLKPLLTMEKVDFSPGSKAGPVFTAGLAVAALLPASVKEALLKIKVEGEYTGYIVIRNLPTDPEWTATPADGQPSPDKKTQVSELCLLGVGAALGIPYRYASEKRGWWIHDICPVRGQEKSQSNAGSEDLKFHTENTGHVSMPDWILLFGLKADHEGVAETYVSSINEAIPYLDEATKSALRKPVFKATMPVSFGADANKAVFRMVPVLSGPDGRPRLIFNRNTMTTRNRAAKKAFVKLGEVLDRNRHTLRLRPGDLAVIDNRQACHARGPFTPRWEGDEWKNNRHLQRLYVRELVFDLKECMDADSLTVHFDREEEHPA